MSTRISKEGERVPAVQLAEMKDGKAVPIDSTQLFKGRRVILFALPGAFTPTCSTAHVPGYVALLREFKDAGIADVVCLSVNDPFVMEAWQQSEKAQGIHFVADPYGEFTRAMGMSIEHRDAFLGTRSWRYSMVVNDCVIEKMFIEPDVPGDPFEVSDAQTMLNYLQPNRKTIGPVFMLARHGCQFCAKAKQLLQDRGIPYEAIHLGDELTMQGVKAVSGETKVPQVFIDGKRIGGADKLQKFLSENVSK
ncbi:MAG TPA: glutathione peroxidase [Steroidobacteraceae bacterium]|nr:glutathione peroxidase [Steroidobacteraceae bacterium]